ncbi:MAG TPA: hypothetical protein DCF68_05975 [Cyanothece sp. UBA12306]|nr:hypothetical protein [Cyanothece sp. UBA12306]
MKTSYSNFIVSDAHIFVPKTYFQPRLGELLVKADLITLKQLAKVLEDQAKYPEFRLGEILTIRGWIKRETVDFFAEKWSDCLQEQQKYRLGEYLQQADLLNDRQIKAILYEQKRLGLKFGDVAVLHGWIKPTTLDFFLKNLFWEHQ